MQFLTKVVKWLYEDTLASIAFFVVVFFIFAGFILFINNPMQIVGIIAGCFIVYSLFLFFSEGKK